MIKYCCWACLLALVFNGRMMPQPVEKTGSGIKVLAGGNKVEIQFYSPSIVRVIKSPEGRVFKKESFSVIKTPEKIALSIRQDGDIITLKSAQIQADLNLRTGQAIFYSDAKVPLLREKSGGCQFTSFNDAGSNTFSVSQSFVLDTAEAIYGLGQHQRGNLNQRNQKYQLIQGNTDDAVPVFQSIKGYGVFWDNYSPTTFDDSAEETSFKSDVGDCVDYYFIYGRNADGVIAGLRDLTGQAPMFPLWTFGYWQSKERYKSQDELVGVVKRYREAGVPIDGIIQDWQYWGKDIRQSCAC